VLSGQRPADSGPEQSVDRSDRGGGKIRGFVFDMDGVLLDSEPLHHHAVNQLLRADGCRELSFDEYVPYMGTTDDYTWGDLASRFALPSPAAVYIDRYNGIVLDLYRNNAVIAPGARSLLLELRRMGLGLAVASSSRRAWVEACLESLGIRDLFNVVLSGEMVKRSKPDPEIFLLAARALGLEPGECVAIEDSPNGVASAVAAGMYTVAVASPYPTAGATNAAHIHLTSLEEFDCSLLQAGVTQPQTE
jgi:HAD superfamily hydrolase (TIGR01509 family)